MRLNRSPAPAHLHRNTTRREIAGCGFSAVKLWEAHAAPESLTRASGIRFNLENHP
jgi:hypothetical protein